MAETLEMAAATSTPVARELADTAPWTWLEKGWADYKKQPLFAVTYGVIFVLIGYGIIFGLKSLGLMAAMPVAVGAFALVGPLMAAGLYALARALERGEQPKWGDIFFVKVTSPVQVAYLGVFLLVFFFVWALCAMGLLVIFAASNYIQPAEFLDFATSTLPGLALLGVGTAIGGFIALTIFSLTAFSIPMLIDRDIDFATAMAASFNTVNAQRKPMLLWAWIIGGSVVIGAVTLLIGFILLFPLIGLATWHGYRDAFGS